MTACIRRREFITLFGSAAMAWPSSAPAQQSQRVRRIGVLANEPWPALEGLYEGMRELGYGEGEGLLIEYRFAEGAAERFPGLASELVRLPVDVIVTWGTPATLAALKATSRLIQSDCRV
jgi:putative tryptophan/tyrosine transport system substrate-binding protein